VELETQLEIARNLGFINVDQATGLLAKASEIGRMLNGLLSWAEKTDHGRTDS
jgi:four helix bundle protein